MSSRKKATKTEHDQFSDLSELIMKWTSIPVGILTVLVAGSALNLIGFFLKLKDDLGLDPTQQEFIRWAVAFGFYGGFIAGPLVSLFSNRLLYILGAVFSLVSLIVLAFYTNEYFLGQFSVSVIIINLAVVSLCGCIATIAAISTIIKNFPGNVSSLLVAMMIAYYMVSPYFEKSVREAFFKDSSMKLNLIMMAVLQSVTYFGSAFLLRKVQLKKELQRASQIADRTGIAVFLIIELIFIAVIYFTCIIAEKWTNGIILMATLILANFICLGVTIKVVNRKLKDVNTDNLVVEDPISIKSFTETIGDPNIYGLMISTFFVVGSGTAFHLEAPTVAFAMNDYGAAKPIMKIFWISDASSRFIGGIISALLSRILNRYLFSAALCFLAMLGFSLALLSQPAGIVFFYISSISVGVAVGGMWVIIPQIILEHVSKNSFETLWGLVININLLGVFTFERLFMWIADKEEPYEVGTCIGVECYLCSFICSAILGGLAGGICLFGYSNHLRNEERISSPQPKNKKAKETKN